MDWVIISVCLINLLSSVKAAHLIPGIVRTTIQVEKDTQILTAFHRTAYAHTQIELRLTCIDASDYSYNAQFALRSTPCLKEFNELSTKDSAEQKALNMFYFDENKTPEGLGFNYKALLYYKSDEKTINCRDGTQVFDVDPGKQMKLIKSQPKSDRTVRQVEVQSGSNGNNTISHNRQLTTFHPTMVLPADGVYLLVVRLSLVNPTQEAKHNITAQVTWKSQHGYLDALNWPLLPFYGCMCAVYGVYALAWLIVSLCQYKDLLRIQFWIGAVILLGMLEKAIFYAEYQTVNTTGKSVDGAIQFAELISCIKRTLSRMLIIIVSVGFGVVKPRLGATLHKIVAIGLIYFLLCSIEGITRSSDGHAEAMKRKQLALLPLTLLEVGIFWWVFTSLVSTMRALRLRRNEVKLNVYRHFSNTLVFAVIASVAFMIWMLVEHTFSNCEEDWKELWIDTAFWHLLFSVILLVIMILWRPANNNQRYAFSPLLDYPEDLDDDDQEDTIFSEAFTNAEAIKLRSVTAANGQRRGDNQPQQPTIEDELKWVEEHIPSSIAEKIMADSDEEIEQSKYEMSKMQ